MPRRAGDPGAPTQWAQAPVTSHDPTPAEFFPGWVKQEQDSRTIAVKTVLFQDPVTHMEVDWAVMTVDQGGFYTGYEYVQYWPDVWPTGYGHSYASFTGRGVLAAVVRKSDAPITFTSEGTLAATVVVSAVTAEFSSEGTFLPSIPYAGPSFGGGSFLAASWLLGRGPQLGGTGTLTVVVALG